MERSYEAAFDQCYSVVIAFDFASADWGSINLWRIVAGAAGGSPAAADAVSAPLDTGTGEDTDRGLQWVEQTVTVDARSSPEGEPFVYRGVWGTSEFLRTYYIDNVRVTLTRVGPAP